MSNDGDASNRLSAALDQILSRSDPGEGADVGGEAAMVESPVSSDSTPGEGADVGGEAAMVESPVSSDPTPGEGADVGGEAAMVESPVSSDPTPDEPYEMPEIVPATEAPRAPASPTLPARNAAPGPARPSTPAAAPGRALTTAVAPRPAPSSGPVAAGAATSWSDHVTAVPAGAASTGLRAPGRKPRVRRVTRVLRHIDPWSTFKVALLFSLVTYLVALTSGVLLWRVADRTGTRDNVERWFTQFGWETFELQGGEIFRNAWVIGLFGVVAMTGGLVLLATVFNLVSDIIGGVRVTVLEEEVVERTVTSTRRYVVRQGHAAAGVGPVPQHWDVDDDEGDEDAGRGAAGGSSAGETARSSQPAAPASAPPIADWSVDD